MTGDRIRMLRVIEYSGPRAAVERQIAQSLHGEKTLSNGLTIKAATLGAFPEIIDAAEPADFGAWSD